MRVTTFDRSSGLHKRLMPRRPGITPRKARAEETSTKELSTSIYPTSTKESSTYTSNIHEANLLSFNPGSTSKLHFPPFDYSSSFSSTPSPLKASFQETAVPFNPFSMRLVTFPLPFPPLLSPHFFSPFSSSSPSPFHFSSSSTTTSFYCVAFCSGGVSLVMSITTMTRVNTR